MHKLSICFQALETFSIGHLRTTAITTFDFCRMHYKVVGGLAFNPVNPVTGAIPLHCADFLTHSRTCRKYTDSSCFHITSDSKAPECPNYFFSKTFNCPIWPRTTGQREMMRGFRVLVIFCSFCLGKCVGPSPISRLGTEKAAHQSTIAVVHDQQ